MGVAAFKWGNIGVWKQEDKGAACLALVVGADGLSANMSQKVVNNPIHRHAMLSHTVPCHTMPFHATL